MRILLVSNYAWTVFNFRRELIAHLQKNGHLVYVQTEFDGYEERLGLPKDRVLPLDIDRKGMNPWRDARTVVSIVAALRKTKVDACLLFTIKPVVYGGIAATLLSRHYICNITGLGTAFLAGPWLWLVAQVLFRLALRRAHRVFFQNEDDRSTFIDRGIVSEHIASRLPGSGVDTVRFSAMPPTGNSTPVFLMVARLLRDKGVMEFVEAARLVKKKLPFVRFQLLGPLGVINRTAVTRAELQEWVEEGIIEYLGETDDVRPFLQRADCVVLPSYREGSPRSLLEAASVGRPVIASDIPGCREIIEDGHTGLLCRPKDSSDLAAKIEMITQLPEDARREMGLRGRRKVERDFDERIVLDQYELSLHALRSFASRTAGDDSSVSERV